MLLNFFLRFFIITVSLVSLPYHIGQSSDSTAQEDSKDSDLGLGSAPTLTCSIEPLIPDIARGYEDIYLRFIKGKLIYKPDQETDIGRIEIPFGVLPNPLEGTFDLSECGDAGKYLSVSTGYRKGKKAENSSKFVKPPHIGPRDKLVQITNARCPYMLIAS